MYVVSIRHYATDNNNTNKNDYHSTYDCHKNDILGVGSQTIDSQGNNNTNTNVKNFNFCPTAII